jgi:Amino acid transporters
MVMPEQGLKRNIKLFEGILFVIGFVIGSGIFMKPSVVLKNMGSPGAALAMWIIGGIITLCAALSIAEIAAYTPKLGGLYTYLSDIFGNVFGFEYGWVEAIIASPGGSAAMAIAISTLMTYFLPMDGTQQKIFAIGLVVFIIVLNIIATKCGVWLQTVVTAGKLIPIFAIMIWGLVKGGAHAINFVNIGAAGTGFGVALLGVLWAYDGWINTCTLGEEMERPEKNLPKSIITGVLFVMAVYVLFNIAIFNTLPAKDIVASSKVGVDVSNILFGKGATAFITIGMIVSVIGALNAQEICGTRIALAMGGKREILGGKVLGAIHPKLRTPVNSLIFQGIITIIFILGGTFNSLSDLTIFVIWIFFTMGVIGVFVLRKRIPRNDKLYKIPLYPIVPAIGVIGGVYLIYATIAESFSSAMLGLGLTVIGLPIFYYCHKKNSANKTV